MSEDPGNYVDYVVVINGEEHKLTARGWAYTHVAAHFDGAKWRADSWHGHKIGQQSSACERAQAVVDQGNAGRAGTWHLCEVGKSYSL